MPSVRANCTPTSNAARWWTLWASITPCSLSRDTSGATPRYRSPPAWMGSGVKQLPHVCMFSPPAVVDGRGDELAAQRVHLDDRGHVPGIAEVVGVDAAGQRRRRLWLG